MKIKLKNPEISTPLVVLSLVTIVMLGPQLLSQPTFAQQPVNMDYTCGSIYS